MFESWEIYIIIYIAVVIIIVSAIVFSNIKLEKRLKSLKLEWTWELKKAKICWVKKEYHRSNSDNWSQTYYYLEAEDEQWNKYRSKVFPNVRHWWRSESEMIKFYNWKEYNLAKKDTAIKQLNEEILYTQLEIDNDPGIFKKLKLKFDLKVLKEYLRIAEEWAIPPYLEINHHRVSVWDTIDIYINPDNPKEYYFDLDFTDERPI